MRQVKTLGLLGTGVIRGDDVDAEVQRARRPAAADHPSAEQTQRLDLPHVPYAPATPDGARAFFNLRTII